MECVFGVELKAQRRLLRATSVSLTLAGARQLLEREAVGRGGGRGRERAGVRGTV